MESIKLKTFVCLVLVLFSATTSFGQTLAEFFNQKKTRKKYLLEQIVALKLYAGYLKKGYDIASSGLDTIKDFKNGEFNLHHTFISSLKTVSPAIKNSGKVAQIIAYQLAIGRAFNGASNNEYLSATTQQYLKVVKDKVMEECLNDMEELLLVITSGKVEMTDDERIKRLDKIYINMKDKSVFTQRFTADVSLLVYQKENEQKSINHLKKLYGNQ
ncbi:MAG: hypothetical protein V4541_08975 [Bacteroidota bacterium]